MDGFLAVYIAAIIVMSMILFFWCGVLKSTGSNSYGVLKSTARPKRHTALRTAMHPTNTSTPLFATELFEFTVEVYATHIAYRQYWSQRGSLPLAEIVSVEQCQSGLPDVVVTTRAGTTVGFARRDPVLGDVRELWFIRDGSFFQVTMYAPDPETLDAWIRGLAASMTFVPPAR